MDSTPADTTYITHTHKFTEKKKRRKMVIEELCVVWSSLLTWLLDYNSRWEKCVLPGASYCNTGSWWQGRICVLCGAVCPLDHAGGRWEECVSCGASCLVIRSWWTGEKRVLCRAVFLPDCVCWMAAAGENSVCCLEQVALRLDHNDK